MKTETPRSLRRFTVALALAWVFPASVSAQRYNFKFYGEEEGLTNLAVQVLLQDNTGFLWLGTQNGLFRYDGHQFSIYDKNQGLPSSRIESLHESAQGDFWVGTRVGLVRRNANHFEKIRLPGAEGINGSSGISSDAAGNLYLATEHGLVWGRAVTKRDFQFQLVHNPGKNVDPLVYGTYVDETKGVVWYGCGRQICSFKNGLVQSYSRDSGVPDDKWGGFIRDRDGVLWARGANTLLHMDAGSSRFSIRDGIPPAHNTNTILALDRQGRLLVSTSTGICRLTGSRAEFITATQGLTSNDIGSIIQDREGSLWVGLLGAGVARWLGYNEWESWSTGEGLSHESVWSIARDKAGRLWAGTQNGLNLAVMNNGRWTWKKKTVPGLEMFRAMAPARDGSLWLGGDPGGLVRSDPVTGELLKFSGASGFRADNILHLLLDHADRLWISTRQGLYRTTGPVTAPLNGLRFEKVVLPGGDQEEVVYSTAEDRDGFIWAAGSRGLTRSNGGEWIRYTDRDGLRSKLAVYLVSAADGAVWLGYREAVGITRIVKDGRRLRLEHFDSASGLKSDKSIFLGRDAGGQIWVGTDHGVDVWDGKSWRHLGRSDGLIWDDCDANAFLADPDMGVWIGTSRGISHYQLSDRRETTVPPPVVITAARLGNVLVSPNQEAIVSYQNNSLVVDFAALTFVQESAVRFRYRLGETMPNWVETSQRELNYARLPAGLYTLEVLARNAHGIWSAEPARMQFEIRQPWWQTWWFRLLMVAQMIGFALLLWRRRLARLEKERVRLEQAVTDRTRELTQEKARAEQEKARVQEQNREIEQLLEDAQQASRLKSEFLANMSHEIRTPMNGVLGMTDLVLASDLATDQREQLQAARTSADSLLALINDILDFSKVEAGRMDLDLISFTLRDTVCGACKTLSLKASEKSLRLDCVVHPEVPEVLVGDPVRLHQVLLNLIGNAIKFTTRGSVEVRVDCEPAASDFLLHFAVEDTGIGIPAEKQQIIFDAFRQADGSTTRKYGGTGLGLSISRRLVELMGGRIWLESSIGAGTTFHFEARFGSPLLSLPPSQTNDGDLRALLAAVAEDSTRIRHRILLAEDNSVNQLLATRLLERRGHAVCVASNGREAVRILEDGHFDVILMDVQMPEVDGLEATAMIREKERGTGRRTPIIAMTAHAMKGDREMCLSAGMDAYVNKPLDAVAFIAIVESVAAGAEPELIPPSGNR